HLRIRKVVSAHGILSPGKVFELYLSYYANDSKPLCFVSHLQQVIWIVRPTHAFPDGVGLAPEPSRELLVNDDDSGSVLSVMFIEVPPTYEGCIHSFKVSRCRNHTHGRDQ